MVIGQIVKTCEHGFVFGYPGDVWPYNALLYNVLGQIP